LIYQVTLIIHIIAVISWMAGLLYLPRLFVYHVNAPNTEAASMLATMEKNLLKIIMNPALIIVWISGLSLALSIGFSHNIWLHIKIALVVLMTILHMFMGHWRKQLLNNTNTQSALFFRIINEAPIVIAIAIVTLVIIKPF
jgi:putative membrane protein